MVDFVDQTTDGTWLQFPWPNTLVASGLSSCRLSAIQRRSYGAKKTNSATGEFVLSRKALMRAKQAKRGGILFPASQQGLC